MDNESKTEVVALINEIENTIPLEYVYDEDARYNWPNRWEKLKIMISNMKIEPKTIR